MRRDTRRSGVFARRALLMMGGQVALLGGLAARLYQVQGVDGARYATLAERIGGWFDQRSRRARLAQAKQQADAPLAELTAPLAPATAAAVRNRRRLSFGLASFLGIGVSPGIAWLSRRARTAKQLRLKLP